MIEEILSMDTNTDLKILKKLEKQLKTIQVSSDCAIGVEAATMVLKGLSGFREDYESHILNHCCADNVINQRQSVPCRRLSCRRGCTGIHITCPCWQI